MVFNSLIFLGFFVSFFFAYWLLLGKSLKLQNLLLLLGSYVFYSFANWRLLFILIAISAFNYLLGILIEKNTNPFTKKVLLLAGLVQGIGGLLYFKYFNFFIDAFKDAFSLLNVNINLHSLNIIVPLGISFFTFRTISYLLDVYNEKISAVKDPVVFFTYVSFFPSLLSGPIDKAVKFVPQLETKRNFDYAQVTTGLRQVLWGLFKKVVIADNCGVFTNPVFENFHQLPASSLLLGLFLYTIQVYADFSGYSDMAIGFARLLGFNITRNFDYPFFAQNIAQFWRKWHISLTSWFTEYVFTPLSIAFRDLGQAGLILAILINLTIVGMWHGANWTYLLFGLIHGILFIPLILKGTMNKQKKLTPGKILPSFREFVNIAGTFLTVMLTIILFRCDNISQAFQFFTGLFSFSIFTYPVMPVASSGLLVTFILVMLMLVIEWLGRDTEFALLRLGYKWPVVARWVMYYIMIIAIFYFSGKEQQFIYFKF